MSYVNFEIVPHYAPSNDQQVLNLNTTIVENRRSPDFSSDFPTLEKMEWAFSKGDIAFFKTVMDQKPSILLRIHAVCMLADMKTEAAIPLLAEALREDDSPLVRHEAAFAMGQLTFKSGVPSLIEAMMNDPSVLVRHESAVALGSIGDERARESLIARLDDEDEDVRVSAQVALADLDFLKKLKSRTQKILD